MVAGYITPDQFLSKQTEVLQFAVDLQTVRQVAEAKNNSAATKNDTSADASKAAAPAGTTAASSATSGAGSSKSASSASASKAAAPSGKAATSPGATSSGSATEQKKPAPNPAITSIQDIARDLGVKVTVNAGTVQSGSEDYVV